MSLSSLPDPGMLTRPVAPSERDLRVCELGRLMMAEPLLTTSRFTPPMPGDVSRLKVPLPNARVLVPMPALMDRFNVGYRAAAKGDGSVVAGRGWSIDNGNTGVAEDDEVIVAANSRRVAYPAAGDGVGVGKVDGEQIVAAQCIDVDVGHGREGDDE